jgi:hypothetical protein
MAHINFNFTPIEIQPVKKDINYYVKTFGKDVTISKVLNDELSVFLWKFASQETALEINRFVTNFFQTVFNLDVKVTSEFNSNQQVVLYLTPHIKIDTNLNTFLRKEKLKRIIKYEN